MLTEKYRSGWAGDKIGETITVETHRHGCQISKEKEKPTYKGILKRSTVDGRLIKKA